MRKLVVTAALIVAGALAPEALAATGPGNTGAARDIVNANVGDVPAPNEQGIANPLFGNGLPDAAFNSVTRNPVCGSYTGTAP